MLPDVPAHASNIIMRRTPSICSCAFSYFELDIKNVNTKNCKNVKENNSLTRNMKMEQSPLNISK